MCLFFPGEVAKFKLGGGGGNHTITVLLKLFGWFLYKYIVSYYEKEGLRGGRETPGMSQSAHAMPPLLYFLPFVFVCVAVDFRPKNRDRNRIVVVES